MENQKFIDSVNKDIADKIRGLEVNCAIEDGKDAIVAVRRLLESRLREVNTIHELYTAGTFGGAPLERLPKKSTLVSDLIQEVQGLDQYNGEIMRGYAALTKYDL